MKVIESQKDSVTHNWSDLEGRRREKRGKTEYTAIFHHDRLH